MLKTAEQLQKANTRFNLLVAAVVAAFAFPKEQEDKLNAEDFSAIAPAVEELQKPAAQLRATLKAGLKLSDEDLSGADSSEKITSAINAKDTKISELTTRAEKADIDLATANGEVTKLKAEAKTADERAREIAARAGGSLPPKKPEVGNQTIQNAGAATGTWREKLTSFWKIDEPATA